MLHNRGKAPTLKQFAKTAETATNYWFGGDVHGLYGAIGEKAPAQPQRLALLPDDRYAFAQAVFTNLGGTPFSWETRLNVSPESPAYVAQRQASEQHDRVSRLANLSFWYVQLEEALGGAPTLKEFGPSKFEWLAPTLHENIEHAWHLYGSAIDRAKQAVAVPVALGRDSSSHDQQIQHADQSGPSQTLFCDDTRQHFADEGLPGGDNTASGKQQSWFARLLRRNSTER